MSLIHNYKDIQDKMLGELKAKPKKVICKCNNTGWVYNIMFNRMDACSVCDNWKNLNKPGE